MRILVRATLLALVVLSTAVFTLAQDPKPAESPTPPQEVKPSAGDKTGAVEQKPLIYFYRIKQYAGSGLEPTVYCDDKETARMDNGRYFGVTLEPGKHTCRMGDKQTGFEIDMKPSQVFYARVTLEAGFWKGHGRLTLMQNEQGAFEMKKVKLLGADKVKDRSLVTIFEGSDKKP